METGLGVGRPHAVCVPLPCQSHINAMIEVAKLLHSKGFLVTFVNTAFIHRRLLRSRGPDSFKVLDNFRFESMPDGLDDYDEIAWKDIRGLVLSTYENCLAPFRNLLKKLNDSADVPQVTCTIADGFMSFTLQAAEELGIPGVLFWSVAACSFMGFFQYSELVRRGIIPLTDEQRLSDGYLDTVIDWIPGMRGIRLKDLPDVTTVKDPEDPMVKFAIEQTHNSFKASAIIFNTFDDLEEEVLDALKSMFRRVYTIGPLSLQFRKMQNDSLKSVKMNFWKEETECLDWLDKREVASVIYVNFGSLAVLTCEQFNELAWGLANSNYPFLWIIRPDGVKDGATIFPEDFMKEIEGRGLIGNWCPQEEVLSHPSIGWFLTHCGWNSMMQSICAGVPMICRPMFGDQPTDSYYACNKWGTGIEIGNDMKREEIEGVIRQMMEGEKGKEMKAKAIKWKETAETATSPGGSSYTNFDRLIDDVLLSRH